MDKIVGSIFFVFISLLHLSHCEQTLYNYTDDCTKLTVKITAYIVYPQKNNGKGTANITGSDFSEEDPLTECEDGKASLNIVWMDGLYSLTLDFTEHSDTWELSSIQFEYSTSEFNDPQIVGDTLETKVTGITGIKLGDSYRCMSGVTYNLTSQSSTVQLTLTDLQVQAFNFTMPEEFGKAKDCSVTPPVIPPVHVHSNLSCALLSMTIKNITITYQNTSGYKNEVDAMIQHNNYSVVYNNCRNLSTQGNSKHAKITIGWLIKHNHYNLTFTFSANYKKGQQGWEVGGMILDVNDSTLNEAPARLSFSKDFTDDDIALTRSYKCDQDDQYDFKSDSSNSSTTATISLSFIQMQAFQFSDPSNQAFGSAVECDQAATSVIVPILVGAALGLFVVILLLAYVVGRVRQRRAKSGYQRL